LLLRRLPPSMLNGTGPAMREKVYKMQKLYQKHKSQGLTSEETGNLLELRKLMQLKAMVTSLLASYQIDFDRFCFYGCYCLPDAAVHDKSPGTGRPVDSIDNACKELKMCYQCSDRDTKNDSGETCDQLSAYSVSPIIEHGRVVDYSCDNARDSCRWRICQCDRAFAHKIKLKHLGWKQSNHQVEGEFDRATCVPEYPEAGSQRECCGSYDSPYASQQRQILTRNSHQCCNNSPVSAHVRNPIKPIGELC
jgi:hypothetical protein